MQGPSQQTWRRFSSQPMGQWMKGALTGIYAYEVGHSLCSGRMMLNTEALWNKALTDNNVRGIIYWLRHLTTEADKCNVEKSLAHFSFWLQRSVHLTKKELLTLCFGQCEGLWMFLDQNSFAKVHLLTQKLKNLLSLVCLGKTQAVSMVRWGCSNDQHTLRQHIFLGKLVQWWSLTGLLPQFPDAHELKQISQMWRQMDRNQKRACLNLRCDVEDKYRWSSLIQGIVSHMEKQHGPLWVSEDCAYQTYPPPSLQALLNLVVVPHINITSVQAVIMYFVLDVSNFLHCNDDLLESFRNTFSISPSFSKQIHGFWLLDYGFVSDSMEMLLSPKASSALLTFHHYAVLRTLLRQGERRSALKYFYYKMPAIESIQDARLCVDVLLQNKCVSEAWMLLRRGQPGNRHLLKHFILECEKPSFCLEALDTVSKDMVHLHLTEKPVASKPESINQGNLGLNVIGNNPEANGQSPRPLSALLYQCLINNSLSPGDLITLLKESVTELNSPQKATREVVVWPKLLENAEENRNKYLSHQAIHDEMYPVSSSPTPVLPHEEPRRQPEQQLLEDDLPVVPQEADISPSVASSNSSSPDGMTSTCSFTSAPSSPPAVRSETVSRRGSILPLQNPFAIPSDEDCQEPVDSQMPPEDVIAQCPELTLTLDGTTEATSFKSLRRESAIELDTYECVEEFLTFAVEGNVSDPTESLVEITQTQKRSKKFNLPPQCYSNEDNQAVPSTAEIPVDSHNFLTPGYEKIVYDKVVSEDIIKAENVIEEVSLSPPEQKADTVLRQDSISTEASETSSFLELKPLMRALSVPVVEKRLEVFSRDSQDAVDQPEILTSCALTETKMDLLGQIHERDASVKEGEQCQPASLTSLRSSILQINCNPKRHGSPTHQLQVPLGVSLSSHTSPPRSTQLSSSDQARDKSPGEAVCFRTTSAPVGHCKLGSWWKQGLETRRASTGLLPAVEQVPAVKEKGASLILGRSQSQGPVSYLESSTKPKGGKKESKKAVKEESSSRRGSCKVASHPAEQGSAAPRGQRGKRGKRFKQA